MEVFKNLMILQVLKQQWMKMMVNTKVKEINLFGLLWVAIQSLLCEKKMEGRFKTYLL